MGRIYFFDFYSNLILLVSRKKNKDAGSIMRQQYSLENRLCTTSCITASFIFILSFSSVIEEAIFSQGVIIHLVIDRFQLFCSYYLRTI